MMYGWDEMEKFRFRKAQIDEKSGLIFVKPLRCPICGCKYGRYKISEVERSPGREAIPPEKEIEIICNFTCGHSAVYGLSNTVRADGQGRENDIIAFGMELQWNEGKEK